MAHPLGVDEGSQIRSSLRQRRRIEGDETGGRCGTDDGQSDEGGQRQSGEAAGGGGHIGIVGLTTRTSYGLPVTSSGRRWYWRAVRIANAIGRLVGR
jgi:hypothetical protein